jgi:uncharacterized protein (TIGR00725 family)
VIDRPVAYVAVVGAGEEEDLTNHAAEEVGRELGRQGAVLVCGGLTGVMAAACKGATSEGGLTIGLLPGLERSEANPHVDIAIPTGMGEMRNALIVRATDAVIAVGGEFGTLSEIAFALKTGVPVVGLGTWELGRGKRPDPIIAASSPAEAVATALRLASG